MTKTGKTNRCPAMTTVLDLTVRREALRGRGAVSNAVGRYEKQTRVPIRHVGAIYADGVLLGECTVLDVSVSGARVLLKQDQSLVALSGQLHPSTAIVTAAVTVLTAPLRAQAASAASPLAASSTSSPRLRRMLHVTRRTSAWSSSST